MSDPIPANSRDGGGRSASPQPPWAPPRPNSPDHRLLLPASASPTDDHGPLIICFHGSGESCAPSWSALAALLQRRYRLLLFERGADNPKPAQATAALRQYLAAQQLPPPYVLVAHSYGGAFARAFLQSAPEGIAGMVLVETGQEGGLDPHVAQQQLERRIMTPKPVAVIRGNTFIGKTRDLDAMEQATTTTAEQKVALAIQREMLRLSDREDERMKKAQLQLSTTSRYVHLPDCGHHVVRDRPDVVANEVAWVFDHLRQCASSSRLEPVVDAAPSLWERVRKALSRVSRRRRDTPLEHSAAYSSA